MNASDWISVKDRLPNHGDHVSAYGGEATTNSSPFHAAVFCQGSFLFTASLQRMEGVTHWQPFVAPESEEDRAFKEWFKKQPLASSDYAGQRAIPNHEHWVSEVTAHTIWHAGWDAAIASVKKES